MGTTPPPAPVGYGRQREVSFLQDGVPPPSALYIGPGEGLELRAASLDVGTYVRLYLRMLDPQGKIIPHRFEFVTAAAGAANTWRLPLSEGFLLSAAVDMNVGGIRPGRVYTRLDLIQIGAGVVYPRYTLISGYLSLNDHLMWPPAHSERIGSGRGNIQLLQSAAPAAGAELVVVVTAATINRMISVRFTLTTAVAAGNRVLTLQYAAFGGPYWEGGANVAQPPSTTYTYVASTAPVQGPLGNNVYAIPLPPDLCLFPGSTLTTATVGIAAADQYTLAQEYVEQWILVP